jgi:excisionase family DNA binding protein
MTTIYSSPTTWGLTVNEACRRLTCGRTLFYSLVKAGHLKPVKIGRRTIIPAQQIESLLLTGVTAAQPKTEG